MQKENAKKTKSVPSKRTRRFYVFLILVGFLAAVVAAMCFYKSDKPTVLLKDRTFTVEVADDSFERSRGLSGRASLPEDSGLLFVFDEPGVECFWMKDMNFNIDILWFDENYQLVHQQRNVAPETFPQNFCPDTNAKYVLELNAGIADKLDLTARDAIKIFNL